MYMTDKDHCTPEKHTHESSRSSVSATVYEKLQKPRWYIFDRLNYKILIDAHRCFTAICPVWTFDNPNPRDSSQFNLYPTSINQHYVLPFYTENTKERELLHCM